MNPDVEWNFITFKERMQQYVESVFGDISEIFRSGEYPTYPLPNFDPDELSQWNDPADKRRRNEGNSKGQNKEASSSRRE